MFCYEYYKRQLVVDNYPQILHLVSRKEEKTEKENHTLRIMFIFAVYNGMKCKTKDR